MENKKYNELIAEALQMLDNDDELLTDMVNELDSWNGYADGFRGFPMYELDELFGDCKVSEFLDKLADGFNHNANYFIDTIWGIDSVDDLADHYRDNVDTEDLLANIINYANHLYFYNDEFEELINAIIDYDEDDETPATAAK